MRIGSGNVPVVKVERVPEAVARLGAYLPTKPCGVWQSLQIATARWLAFSQPSYCSFMTWQLAQAAGSLVRYEPPLA